MEKLVYLREDTWQFLKKKIAEFAPSSLAAHLLHQGYEFSSLSYEELIDMIVDKPGRFLVSVGILDLPDLLDRTVIEDDTGLEYLIDRNAAEGIQRGDITVDLIRLYDKSGTNFSRDQVVEFIMDSESFDQF